MKKPVFFQNLILPSLGIVMGALTLFACNEDIEGPRISLPDSFPETHVIESASFLDFSSNLEKTMEFDLPAGQVSTMEIYLVQHSTAERLTYKLPGQGANNQSFYNYSVEEITGSDRLKVKIERLSGPGEIYHGVSAIVGVRPEPIIEK